MKVMVIGHQRLKGKEALIREWLKMQLIELKPDYAINGMAEGTDQIFAEEALKLGIKVSSVLPFPPNDRHPAQELLDKSFEIVYTDNKYSKEAYYHRDCTMVDAADIVLAVWNGIECGGTWLTIDYAQKKGKDIRFFNI